MAHGYYRGMDDCNYTNQIRTIILSVPPPDYGICVPPLSLDLSTMLQPPTPLTKKAGMEIGKDGCNFGGL